MDRFIKIGVTAALAYFIIRFMVGIAFQNPQLDPEKMASQRPLKDPVKTLVVVPETGN
jgi:hypothetical protein